MCAAFFVLRAHDDGLAVKILVSASGRRFTFSSGQNLSRQLIQAGKPNIKNTQQPEQSSKHNEKIGNLINSMRTARNVYLYCIYYFWDLNALINLSRVDQYLIH